MSDQKNPNETGEETRTEEESSQQAAEQETQTQDQAGEPTEPELTEEQPHRLSALPWILVFLLALIALGGVAGVGWLGYERSQELEAKLTEVNRTLANKPDQEQVEQLRSSLENLDALGTAQERQEERLESYQQDVRQHQEQLEALHADLLKASEPKPRDWQLAEIEYLLRLANQRLRLEEDVQGSLTLFKTAQQRLKAAEVPGTLAIRQALAEDIEELESLEILDRVSLAMDLQSLADKALRLEIQPLAEAPALELDMSAAGNGHQAWYQLLWEEIKSLVVIRQRDFPLEPLPLAADELALKHQISSLLQQAAWAGLRGKENLYRHSLQRTQERFAAFDQQASVNRDFAEQLSHFKTLSVHQELPQVETSLDRLQSFIAERYGRLLPVMEEALEDES
ncbi:conserved protein HemX [Marinospirillum celere]|uniref:Conserved protein HemX n=1 Tax=Marinospirillum celere TaxID=1122252 RepID=A0A1I1I685_9GAMM|nr:uroporphyrinogen-III C-methyltransferase [Marinospirillum celere]SFC31611.1 conserved protein HemX [Marinospirillum celere]